MISIVIPTRNRAYTLAQVAPSYFSQLHVGEVLIVDDCGDDATEAAVKTIAARYPDVPTRYFRHSARKGAAASRITGYQNAACDYVLFGEDDAFLAPNYTETLLAKLKSHPEHGIVSGRIIYLQPGEQAVNAKDRFGCGTSTLPYLDKNLLTLNPNSQVAGDFEVPFTHAIFLTTKHLLHEYNYDPFYARGNGYREETDYQLNLFVNGRKLLVTNDTHCYHLSKIDVPAGGQRSSRVSQFYWNIYYTSYMYDKYFDALKAKLDLPHSKLKAKLIFALSQFKIFFLMPIIKLPRWLYGKIS